MPVDAMILTPPLPAKRSGESFAPLPQGERVLERRALEWCETRAALPPAPMAQLNTPTMIQ